VDRRDGNAAVFLFMGAQAVKISFPGYAHLRCDLRSICPDRSAPGDFDNDDIVHELA